MRKKIEEAPNKPGGPGEGNPNAPGGNGNDNTTDGNGNNVSPPGTGGDKSDSGKDKDKNITAKLPQTGEEQFMYMIALGVLFLAAGSIVLYRQRRKV